MIHDLDKSGYIMTGRPKNWSKAELRWVSQVIKTPPHSSGAKEFVYLQLCHSSVDSNKTILMRADIILWCMIEIARLIDWNSSNKSSFVSFHSNKHSAGPLDFSEWRKTWQVDDYQRELKPSVHES